MSRAIGVSQPALWKLLNDRTRPSLATAEALAGAEGVPVETILTSPRDRAVALAREAGIPEAAVKRVLSELEGEDERPVLWWVDRIRAYAALSEDHPPADSSPPPALPRPVPLPRRLAS